MKKSQIILFVLVIIAIGLIVASSMASRVLIGTRTTQVNTDSSRAFSAAESGIEEILNKSDLASLISGNGSYTASSIVDKSIIQDAGYRIDAVNSGFYETSSPLEANSIVQIEFTGSVAPANVRVFTENQNSCLYLSAIKNSGEITRYFYCANSVSRTNSIPENYTLASSDCSVIGASTTYNMCVPNGAINLTVDTKYLLVQLLGQSGKVLVSAANFAEASKTKNIKVKSYAVTKTGVKREIEVLTKTTRDILPILNYAVFIK